MPFEHLGGLSFRRVVHADAVGDLEARLLAHRLQLGDKLALDALVDEFGREFRIQRDGDALIARGDVALRALGGDEKIFLAKLYFRAGNLRLIGAAVSDCRHDLGSVARFEEGADAVQKLAVLRPQRLHLRLQFIGDERGRVLCLRHLFDVQLVEDDPLQLVVQIEVAFGRHDHLRERLAVFEVARVARGTTQNDHFQHRIHALFELLIDGGLVADGEGAHMHRPGRVLIEVRHEVLVHLLGDERRERRGELGEGDENGVQRGVRRRLVLRHLLAPVPLAAAAHIPVGENVHKILQRAGAVGNVVLVQPLVHRLNEGIELAEDKFIHQREFALFQIVLARVVLVDVRVQHEEGVAVPQRPHIAALRLRHRLGIEAGRDPRRARGVEIPAHRVGALLVEHAPRVDDVALVLGHLYAVFVVDVTQNDAVFEGSLAE